MKGSAYIAVSDADGVVIARGDFGNDGVLVLAAGHTGITGHGTKFVLTRSPHQDALAYAVFVFRRGVAHAIAARSDVSFPDGRRCRVTRSCDFYIGSARFVVSLGRGRRRMRWMAASAIAAAAVLLATFVVLRMPGGARPPKDVAIENSKVNAKPEPEPERDLAGEVMTHMRVGNAEQARLAIIEHVERHGDSEDARRMLASVERGIARERSGSIENVSSARELYDEGLALMKGGELGAALARLREASDLLAEGRGDIPLGRLIEKASTDVAGRYTARIGPDIESLRGLLSKGGGTDPSGATERLLNGVRRCGEIAKLLGSDDILELLERLRSALEDSAGRWLAATQAAELYSGCEEAADGYRRIASLLEEALPGVASAASRALSSCEGGE
jgi:hypothetical protein